MRFSLSTLILIVLVSALGMNLVLLNRKVKLVENQIGEIKKQSSLLASEISFTKRLDLIGTKERANEQFKAIESGRRNMQNQFEDFAEKESQLAIDPKAFSIKTIPTTNSKSRFCFAYRVFVPVGMELNAKIAFDELNPLDTGTRIQDAADFVYSLPQGESVLSLVYERIERPESEVEYFLKLNVGEKCVKQWDVISPQHSFGIIAGHPSYKKQRDLYKFEPQKLVGNFSVSEAAQRFDFLIVEDGDE